MSKRETVVRLPMRSQAVQDWRQAVGRLERGEVSAVRSSGAFEVLGGPGLYVRNNEADSIVNAARGRVDGVARSYGHEVGALVSGRWYAIECERGSVTTTRHANFWQRVTQAEPLTVAALLAARFEEHGREVAEVAAGLVLSGAATVETAPALAQAVEA